MVGIFDVGQRPGIGFFVFPGAESFSDQIFRTIGAVNLVDPAESTVVGDLHCIERCRFGWLVAHDAGEPVSITKNTQDFLEFSHPQPDIDSLDRIFPRCMGLAHEKDVGFWFIRRQICLEFDNDLILFFLIQFIPIIDGDLLGG